MNDEEEPIIGSAFLTGSRVFGTPRHDSDIDLVIMCDYSTAETLRKLSEDNRKIVFGKLNLIIIEDGDEEHYQAWKKGTEDLRSIKPVSRNEAIVHFTKMGVENTGYEDEETFSKRVNFEASSKSVEEKLRAKRNMELEAIMKEEINTLRSSHGR